jgi:hypothetical protein
MGPSKTKRDALNFVVSPINCFYLESMNLTEDQKLRIFIVLALVIGWILVVFFRSGTSWG